MRHFFETRVTAVMLLSCLAGLTVPGLPRLPNETIAVALAALMFVSCYRLRDGGFTDMRWKSLAWFFTARFLLLPPLLALAALWLLPDYSAALLLMTALPVAVAAPAFAHIFGGRLAPVFVLVVLTQATAPLLIPLHFALFGRGGSVPPPMHLFTTLVLCVILPMLAYAFTRRHQKSADYFYAQSTFFSMLIVAFMIAFAVAKVRHILLDDPAGWLAPLGLSLAVYAFTIAFGWFAGGSLTRERRVAYATCSSFNNLGLGVSLALLHFPPEVVLFMALGEISWSLLPAMMRVWLKGTGELRN